MSEVPPMAPAFATKRGALAFCCLVGTLLGLPAVLRAFDLPRHEDRYLTAPTTSGSYSFLQQQIFHERSDLDLAFLGDSLLLTAIETPAVQQAATRSLGRTAQVVTLGWSGRGDDLMFYVLRDLLAHRRVKAVVLRVPHRGGRGLGRGPHPQSYRWLVGCQHDPVQRNLPWIDRATAYALESIGGLRNVLSLLRPNLVSTSPFAPTLGAMLWDVGPDHGPFIRYQPAIHEDLIGPRLVSTLGASTVIRPDRERPSAYQEGYVRGIRDLLHDRGVAVALLRSPELEERRQETMEIDSAWAETFPPETEVIAPSPAQLYDGMTDEQVSRLYFDGAHLNRNGAEYFTNSVMPALLELVIHADKQR